MDSKRNAFSLMEMMVVMLVVSIILALSAPMITKKTVSAGGGHCLWTSLTGGNIGFNANQDDVSVVIGGNNSEIAAMAGNIPRLTISTEKRNTYNPNHYYPHIGFIYKGDYAGHMTLTNNHSIIIGANAGMLRDSSNSIAIGSNALIECSYSNPPATAIAIGANSNCAGGNHTVIGTNAIAYGWNSIAIGLNANVNGYNSIAIGYRSITNPRLGTLSFFGHNATAVGTGAYVFGESGTAIGSFASAHGEATTTLGNASWANNYASIAVGCNARANGYGSIAMGSATNADGISIGYGAQSTESGMSIGFAANSGIRGIAIGMRANDPGWGIAIGEEATTDGQQSHIAIGSHAHAIGDGQPTTAIGYYANAANRGVSLGYYANAFGTEGIAIGNSAKAGEARSIAIGYAAAAFKNNSIAIGNFAFSQGTNTITIGTNVKAGASNTIVIGHGISNSTPDVIQLGDANTTVYIPGKIEFGNITANNVTVKNDLYAGGTTALNNLYYKPTEVIYVGDAYYGEYITKKHNFYRLDPPGRANFTMRVDPNTWETVDGTIDKNLVSATGSSFKITIDGKKKKLTSDKRLKNIMGENYDAMDKIRLLKVYDYTFKKDDLKTPHVGVIAQDLQKIFPNAVTKDENGYLQIRHEDMFFAMINALKELDAKIRQIAAQLAENIKIVTSDSAKIRELTIRVNNQDKEIKKLKQQEKEIAALKKEIAELKKSINKIK